jgi:hypothetical protein
MGVLNEKRCKNIPQAKKYKCIPYNVNEPDRAPRWDKYEIKFSKNKCLYYDFGYDGGNTIRYSFGKLNIKGGYEIVNDTQIHYKIQ